MVTVLGLLIAPVLSVTVRLNVRDVAAVGAVNVGVAVFAPFNDTVVPDVCTHEYDTIVAPAFDVKLPVPSNVTEAPAETVWLGPALAIGCEVIVPVVPVVVVVEEGTQKPFCVTNPAGHVLADDVGIQELFTVTKPVGQLPAAVPENGCCDWKSP
jgi:hypothetical protein